jgi:O-antigen ligase
MEALNPAHRLFPWVTGLLMAGILVVPGAYVLLSLCLALYGLCFLRGFSARVWRPSLDLGALPIWSGIAIYAIVGVGLGWWHGYKIGYFEAFIPMLLAPLIANAVVVAKPNLSMFWFGGAAASVGAFLIAIYQIIYQGHVRAFGGMNNPIIFGDLSVSFSMLSLFAVIFWSGSKKYFVFFLIAFFSGILASFLSGTKGAWLSIIVVVIAFSWYFLREFGVFKKLIFFFASLFVIAVVVYMLPNEFVWDRFVIGFNGAKTWFETGVITDTVSVRFEKWNQAFGMILDKPMFGWGTDGAIVELHQRMIDVGAGIGWTQTENDIFQAGIVHGLLGILQYSLLFLCLIYGFLKLKVKCGGDGECRGLAVLGAFWGLLFLQYGLSVVAMGRNGFRYVLILVSMLFLGFLILHWQQHQNHREQA